MEMNLKNIQHMIIIAAALATIIYHIYATREIVERKNKA